MKHDYFSRTTAFALCIAIAAVCALTPAGPLMADDDTRQISVRASGRVDVAPDRATFQTGVVTQARTAKDALEANSSAMQNLVDGLKALGIKARDLQTSDFSINPQYRRNKNGPPEIEAFEVRNTLAILIRDTDRIGEIIDKSASLGANQFGGLRFVVSGEDEKLDAARTNAIEAARRKAEIYAKAAGATLGDVLRIDESGRSSGPRPVMAGRAMRMEAAPAPIESGEQTLVVTVEVTWELK